VQQLQNNGTNVKSIMKIDHAILHNREMPDLQKEMKMQLNCFIALATPNE
jgi:hypothetical protein